MFRVSVNILKPFAENLLCFKHGGKLPCFKHGWKGFPFCFKCNETTSHASSLVGNALKTGVTNSRFSSKHVEKLLCFKHGEKVCPCALSTVRRSHCTRLFMHSEKVLSDTRMVRQYHVLHGWCEISQWFKHYKKVSHPSCGSNTVRKSPLVPGFQPSRTTRKYPVLQDSDKCSHGKTF